MRSWSLLRRSAALLVLSSMATAAPLTPGNLVVVRIGDGSAALTSAATPVFLDEYTPGGTRVQSIALPVAAADPQRALTNSGTATTEGFLTLSSDRRFFVLAGYNAPPGTPSVASSTTANVNRVIGRIDLAGGIDTTTVLTGNTLSGGNIRSAASDDGSRFWAAGTASSANNGGCWLVSLGTPAAAVQISATGAGALTNMRVVDILASQLVVSSASGVFQGISTIGAGLPIASGQTVTLLPGFPTATGPSSLDFFAADASTLYVADDRAIASGGGVQKWTLSSGSWSLAYTLNAGLMSGCRGLAGVANGSAVTLYATASNASNNRILSVIDAGPTSTFSTVAMAGTNAVARGVRIVPDSGCAAPTVTSDPAAAALIECEMLTMTVAASGAGPLTYQWRRNSTPLASGGRISGATSAALTIVDVRPTDDGSYDCVVSNGCGSDTSSAATLGVTPCPLDVNCDHNVGLSDLAILLTQFGATGGTYSADLDDDGDVDLTDLAMLLAGFGEQC